MKPTPIKLLPETPSSSDDVGAALGLLQGALGDEEKRIRAEGAQAMHDGDFDTATSVIEFARRLLAFRDRVGVLEKEWAGLESARDAATPAVQAIVSKRFFGRRSSGEITPQQDFFRPLLEVLVEMGGSGRTRDVLDRLGEKMKSTLKPKDYEPHQSDTAQIRWRNTAQWARNHMVNDPTDGRMKRGSTNGRWEISDKGRAWLKSAKPHRA
jgi:restriction system protein